MKLVAVDHLRCIEAASDAQSHSYATLMELAGSAVARGYDPDFPRNLSKALTVD